MRAKSHTCSSIPESHDFEANAVCFECSPEINSKSRDGWPCKWLFAGGLSKASPLGIRHRAVCVRSFQCDLIVLHGPSLGTRVPWDTVWEVFTVPLAVMAEGR